MTDKLMMSLDDIIKTQHKPKPPKGARGRSGSRGNRTAGKSGQIRTEAPSRPVNSRSNTVRPSKIRNNKIRGARKQAKLQVPPVPAGVGKRQSPNMRSSQKQVRPVTRLPSHLENLEITIVNDRMAEGPATASPAHPPPTSYRAGAVMDMYPPNGGRPTLERYRAPPMAHGLYAPPPAPYTTEHIRKP